MRAMMMGLAIAGAACLAAPAAAHPEDQAINRVYAAIADAKARGDGAAVADAFAPEALVIDARPGGASSPAEMRANYAAMSARMRQDGISVAAQYRLARRSVAGEIAIDSGYMRQTMTRPGAPAMVQYVKFLVTLRRQPDGSWRITSDASMPSTEEAWNGAARVDGLRYDG